MKKNLLVPTLAIAMSIATGVSAAATNMDDTNLTNNISSEIQTLSEKTNWEIPADTIMLEKNTDDQSETVFLLQLVDSDDSSELHIVEGQVQEQLDLDLNKVDQELLDKAQAEHPDEDTFDSNLSTNGDLFDVDESVQRMNKQVVEK